jgi:PAS domain S-box-containing protein
MGMDKRKRGERRGTDSDEHYRLLIDAVAEYALFLLGPEGNVISWGPGAEQIMGYRAEEIVGQHFSCFYPVEERERGKPGKDLKLAAAMGPQG